MTIKTARPTLRLTALAAAFALAPLAMPVAQADDWTVTGNVGLTTDYVFRGISQTDEGPAIQGGLDVSHVSGFYAGTWGSNVDFNDGDEANIELDYYAGFKGQLTQALSWDAGALYYSYPGANSNLNYDYGEGKVALGYAISDMPMAPTLGLSLYYSPNYFFDLGPTTYVGGSLGLKLMDKLTMTASVGQLNFSDSDKGQVDAMDWKVGLRTEYSGVGFELGYTDTDLSKAECANTDWCEGRAMFTISKSL